jgi:hypothetical protein
VSSRLLTGREGGGEEAESYEKKACSSINHSILSVLLIINLTRSAWPGLSQSSLSDERWSHKPRGVVHLHREISRHLVSHIKLVIWVSLEVWNQHFPMISVQRVCEFVHVVCFIGKCWLSMHC